MKKICMAFCLFGWMFAGEGLPVLTMPELAQEGYLPPASASGRNEISFSYANWYYQTNYSTITAVYDSWIFGFKGLISGNIEIRGEVPDDQPVGTTAYYNTALYAGKKWDIDDHWRIKASAALLTERLFYASSWGASLDAEAAFAFNANYRVLLGFENVGVMTPLNTVPTRLPGRYYAGGEVLFDSFGLSLIGGVTGGMDPFIRWGVRYTHPVFDLTYSYDNIQRIHHAGADIKWNQFRIGYGQYFHTGGLGYPMMFTVGIMF